MLALLAAPPELGAQAVRGVVMDAAGAPLSGVLTQLIDTASRVVAQVLSGDRGSYRLRAPAPGAYVVRSLRIGFRPTASIPLPLTTDAEVTFDVTLASIALRLDTVRVSGRASCQITRDSALLSFRALEQARAALIATSLSDASTTWQLTRVLFERMYDSSFARPTHQRSEWWSGTVTEPWKSVPSDDLHRYGYIVGAADSIVYRAPGLDALSGGEFLNDHCFRLVGSGDSSAIGIAFEPTPERRRVAEISGTIWLDRATAELRRLEFRFVNAPLVQQERNARGELRFASIPGGGWVIPGWRISMPVLELRQRTHISVRGRSRGTQEVAAVGYREVGGELMTVTIETDTLWRHAPVRLGGRVADSSDRAIQGVRVGVSEQRRESIADAKGRFVLDGVEPGEVTLEFRTAALDSLATVVRLGLTAFENTDDLDVKLPTPAAVARAMCGSSFAGGAEGAGRGIALVTLSAVDDRANLAHAKATIEWLSPDGTPHWLDARPDRDGTVHFCGVPLGQRLILSASADSADAESAEVRIAGDQRVVRSQLSLDPAVPVGAIVSGVVVRDSGDVPIPGVEVVFPELAKSQMTSERGLFRLRDIPVGTHRLVVRKMGYGAVDTLVTLRAGETMQRRIVLGRMTALSEVLVTATAGPPDPGMRDFEENRRIGLGHFLTRDDLARFEGGKLSAALAQMPGLRIEFPSASTRAATYPGAYVARLRGRTSLGCTRVELEGAGDSCGCFAQVYLDDAPLFTGKAGTEVPDINRFDPGSLEAVEYYVGAAQVPAKYSVLNNTCGVLVLRTRRAK